MLQSGCAQLLGSHSRAPARKLPSLLDDLHACHWAPVAHSQPTAVIQDALHVVSTWNSSGLVAAADRTGWESQLGHPRLPQVAHIQSCTPAWWYSVTPLALLCTVARKSKHNSRRSASVTTVAACFTTLLLLSHRYC